jgi:hypothetical protein
LIHRRPLGTLVSLDKFLNTAVVICKMGRVVRVGAVSDEPEYVKQPIALEQGWYLAITFFLPPAALTP